MKKTLCIFLSLIMLISAFVCVPFTSQAATYKPDEKIYANAEEIPENAGYYSLIIVKEGEKK